MKNKPTRELQNMVEALESFNGFLNSKQDDKRLQQAKRILKQRRD